MNQQLIRKGILNHITAHNYIDMQVEKVEDWEKIGGSAYTSKTLGKITTTYHYRFYVSTSSEK